VPENETRQLSPPELLSDTKMSVETTRSVSGARDVWADGTERCVLAPVRQSPLRAFLDAIKDLHEQAGRLDRFGRFWRITVAGLPMASRLRSTA
jgi:hypothetical protein